MYTIKKKNKKTLCVKKKLRVERILAKPRRSVERTKTDGRNNISPKIRVKLS